MKNCSIFFLLLVLPLYASSQDNAFITIEGEVLKSLKLTRADLMKFKSSEVVSRDRDGKERKFKGVPLVTLLDSAGVTLSAKLRGENMAKYVSVKAADGYEVIFSLAELDTDFAGATVLVAYEANGSPLAAGEGPFRLVVPGDKRQGRWIRELRSIKVIFSKG